MKQLIFLILVLVLNAKIVDRIVASVDGKPITSVDIEKISKQNNIPPAKALNILIDQKIIENEIEKQGIEVDEFDIQNAMERIAKQNGMSLFEFENILASRGELDKFKANLKKDLLRKKLFDNIVSSKLTISDKEIKNYYENHKDEFKIFKKIDVIKYSSKDKKELVKFLQNPLQKSNVTIEKESFYSISLSPREIFLFKNSKEGEYTPILFDKNGFVSYLIVKKEGETTIPFDKIKNVIANKLLAQKREEILKNYFSKVKNRANIKIYN